MKKVIVGVALLLSLVAIAAANQVIWMTGYGVFAHDSPELIVDNDNYKGVAQDTSVLWQLIWAGDDNIANPIDLSNDSSKAPFIGEIQQLYVSGDDVVIGSRTIAQGGSGGWDDTLFSDDESICSQNLDYTYDVATPYWVFQRVYEESNPGFNYQSDPVQLGTDYASGYQSVYVDIAGNFSEGVRTVPEPATMSLLGLGALAMVLRRKLRK